MDGGAWWAAVHEIAKSPTDWVPYFHFSLSCIGEGNGNSLQYSCLENPRDRGAWWAAVHGVTQSWTQLKQLSSSSSLEAEGTCKTVLLFPHSPVSEISTTLQHGRYHLNVEKTTVKAAFLWWDHPPVLSSSTVPLLLNFPPVNPLMWMPGTTVRMAGPALTRLTLLALFPSAYINADCQGGQAVLCRTAVQTPAFFPGLVCRC